MTRGLLRHTILREPARWAAHAGWIPFKYLSGAYFGRFRARVDGLAIQYLLEPGDTVGEVLFWKGAGFERDLLPRFAQLAKTARGILDIGSNTGLFTLVGCAANPAAKMVAWEPVPHLYKKLQANVELNGFATRCELRRRALSNAAGSATLYIPEDTTMASLNSAHLSGGTSIEIEVETVDAALDPDFPVDLVKIDVETYEFQVLQGMRATLSRWRPAVFVEVLPTVPLDPIHELLSAHGYELSALTSDGLCPIGQQNSHAGFNCNYFARPLSKP